ncbi:MAG TPA: hypothetical protein VFX02_03435 [Gammaproteobacteria bacterium]|nr:hypothetical protein [Gammaproteobacteria bacterium]
MSLHKQRGISMVIVIFLLAVVSVMTLSMATISGTQHMNSLYTQRAAQAYFAARAGMEYAIARVIAVDACPGNPGAIPGMNEFNVVVACVRSPAGVATFNEGGAAYSIFRLTVTASSGNFAVPDVATRQITATVRRP